MKPNPERIENQYRSINSFSLGTEVFIILNSVKVVWQHTAHNKIKIAKKHTGHKILFNKFHSSVGKVVLLVIGMVGLGRLLAYHMSMGGKNVKFHPLVKFDFQSI